MWQADYKHAKAIRHISEQLLEFLTTTPIYFDPKIPATIPHTDSSSALPTVIKLKQL